MSDKKPTEAEMLHSQDEALAERLADLLGIKSPSGSDKKATPELVEVATELRTQIIDPAVIAGSTKLLKAHRNALYDSVPVGDIDAMGLLNIIQNHLAVLDETIQGLERSLIAEAEVVENEDEKS